MDSGLTHLILSSAALVVALIALCRAYVPPQTRAVRELQSEVADLGADHDALKRHVHKRVRVDQAEGARDAREAKRARQDRLEQEALAIIERGQQAPQQQLPLDPDTERAQLRAKVLQ